MAEKEARVMSGAQRSELQEIMKCCACADEYTDPRILPCIHTFCLQCLKDSASTSGKRPGDDMPCPVCRTPFVIPGEGLAALQKNIFVSRLIEVMKKSDPVSTPCEVRLVDVDVTDDYRSYPAEAQSANINCTECLSKRFSSDHTQRICGSGRTLVTTENQLNKHESLRKTLSPNQCKKHDGEQLRLYCIDCRTVVCVLCFIETHQSHKCNDVDKAADQFRHQLQKYINILDEREEDETDKVENIEAVKRSFMHDVDNVERSITRRSHQLRKLIDKEVECLLVELASIKHSRLNEIDNELEEHTRQRASLESFRRNCAEFKSKGSSAYICQNFSNLQKRADDLVKLQRSLTDRQVSLPRVSFTFTDVEDFLTTDLSSVFGKIEESTLETVCIVIGSCDGMNDITSQVISISLEPNAGRQSPEVGPHHRLPTLPTPCMQPEAAAAASDDSTFFVVGVGERQDEIWKYEIKFGWIQCHGLVQGRERHCVQFVGSTLYIGGGTADQGVLSSVEGYNTFTNTCARVGELVVGVECATCAEYKESIYFFGGAEGNGENSAAVQVYSVVLNSCTLLTQPMPRPQSLLRSAVWKSFAVLIGPDDSFLFDFEGQTWHERNRFQTGLVHFGLMLTSNRIFVIGGGVDEQDADGDVIWKCTGEVRSIPVRSFIKDEPPDWAVQTHLPSPTFVDVYVGLTLPSSHSR